jgi:hypothetical protein
VQAAKQQGVFTVMSPIKQRLVLACVLLGSHIAARADTLVANVEEQVTTASASVSGLGLFQAMADAMPVSRSAAWGLGLLAAAAFIYQRSRDR